MCVPHSLQRVGSVVFAASMWVLPTAAPTFYLRWRKELLILYRIGFFAFPLLRKPRGESWACSPDTQELLAHLLLRPACWLVAPESALRGAHLWVQLKHVRSTRSGSAGARLAPSRQCLLPGATWTQGQTQHSTAACRMRSPCVRRQMAPESGALR